MLHYFTIHTTAEIICLVMALISLRNDSDTVWRSMIFFLLITCAAEISGIYIKRLYFEDHHIHLNAWVYNILIFFQAGFFSLVYQKLLRKYINCKPVIISGFAFLFVFHVYRLIFYGIFTYDELTNTVMSVLIVLYSLYFYFCLIKDDQYVNLKVSPEFWWVAGTLFFYFGTTVFNLFYDTLVSIMIKSKDNLGYQKYFNNAFNIILYTCWSYSFICRRWLTPTSKSLS